MRTGMSINTQSVQEGLVQGRVVVGIDGGQIDGRHLIDGVEVYGGPGIVFQGGDDLFAVGAGGRVKEKVLRVCGHSRTAGKNTGGERLFAGNGLIQVGLAKERVAAANTSTPGMICLNPSRQLSTMLWPSMARQ